MKWRKMVNPSDRGAPVYGEMDSEGVLLSHELVSHTQWNNAFLPSRDGLLEQHASEEVWGWSI